ncbi:hypothetical protein L1887_30098 [Cichorium endivia]|nr:hypothetical protein L1887_30098 [Cichorium endivia]
MLTLNYFCDQTDRTLNYFAPAHYVNSPRDEIEAYPNNQSRRHNYSLGIRQLLGRAFQARREDSIKRTVMFLTLIKIVSINAYKKFKLISQLDVAKDDYTLKIRVFRFVKTDDNYESNGGFLLVVVDVFLHQSSLAPEQSTIGNSLQDRTRGPLSLAVSGIAMKIGLLPEIGNDMAEEGVDQELLAEAENVALLQAANFNGHKWSICATLDIYTVHL